ncbi:MAG: hypothetical protein R6W89_10855 [Candidatus Hydrogenedentota bacterium]
MKQCIGGFAAFLIVLAGAQAEPGAFSFERAGWPSEPQGEIVWLTMTGAEVKGGDGRETNGMIRTAAPLRDGAYLQVEGAPLEGDASRMTEVRLSGSRDEAGEEMLVPCSSSPEDAAASVAWDAEGLYEAVREAGEEGAAPTRTLRYQDFTLTIAPQCGRFDMEGNARSIEALDLTVLVAETRPDYLPVYGPDAQAMEVEKWAHARIEPGADQEEALQTLADALSKTVFRRLPIQVIDWVTRDDGAEYAVLDLREPEQGPGWAGQYFQGSTGGRMTTQSLVRTLGQCVGPEPHGLIFHHEGDPIEPQDWDHIPGLAEPVAPSQAACE